MHDKARRTGRGIALVLGAGALGLTLTHSAHVPLYDGVGFPDEPYRYLQPPAGAPKTAPPASVHATLTFTGGLSADEKDFASSEVGPQVDLFVAVKSLVVNGPIKKGRISVVLAATPLVGPPTDGAPNSNDYRAEMTAPGGAVAVSVSSPLQPFLTLRSASTIPETPEMNYRATPTDPWRELDTARDGQDIYRSKFLGPGEYLLVQPAAAAGGTPRTESGPHTGLFVALGLAGLILLGLIVVRLRARPKPE